MGGEETIILFCDIISLSVRQLNQKFAQWMRRICAEEIQGFLSFSRAKGMNHGTIVVDLLMINMSVAIPRILRKR